MTRMSSVKLIGAISGALILASAILLFVLGTTYTTRYVPICGLAVTAGALQLVSLAVLVSITWRVLRHVPVQEMEPTDSRHCNNAIAGPALGLVMCVAAGGASVGTFVWISINTPTLSSTTAGHSPSALFMGSLILWISSVISQAVLYTLLVLLGRRVSVSRSSIQSNPRDAELLETIEISQPGTTRTLHTSSPPSPHVPSKHSSLRSSLTIAVRPVTSRTKLVGRQQSYPASIATTRASTDSAFDTWDTSSISPQMRETVLRSSPAISRNPLPPIPGSRSPSPAKALEGPFPLPDVSLTARPSTSWSQPSSPPPVSNNMNSSHSHFTNSWSQPSSPISNHFFNFAASSFPRPSLPRGRLSSESLPFLVRTRSASANSPVSPTADEEHIHPLFRTNSPTPPPTATPGTTVTAAPSSFAGLMIQERIVRRMRSGSAPTSPSPLTSGTGYFFPEGSLVRLENGSLPGSSQGLGIGGGSDDEEDEIDGGGKVVPEEDRKMTPPIPEFILASGKNDWTDHVQSNREQVPKAG